MGRKGKEPAGPSKRAKMSIIPAPIREEAMPQRREDEVMEDVPTWRGGPLSKMPSRFQAYLWYEKMKGIRDRRDAYLVEREVPKGLFAHHGIHERFERLGWGAVLKCYDGEEDKLFAPYIDEWMSSLKLEGASNKRTMKLVGECKRIKVTMSMATLKRIASFDSLPLTEYEFPSEDVIWNKPDKGPLWDDMRDTLFKPGMGSTFKRIHLKKEPRLLQSILMQNVMPRRGDKDSVRFCDIPILYSLMTGRTKVSFCYLAMMNIWLARETKGKQIVPHCRLIQALMKQFKVMTHSEYSLPHEYIVKDMEPFNLTLMERMGWFWSINDRYAQWKHRVGDVWKVKRLDARPSESGEDSEPEDVSEEDTGRHEDLNNTVLDADNRPPYAMPDGMWLRVQQCRPDGFDTWPNYNQNSWDLQQHVRLQADDDARAVIENQNRWNRINLVHQEVQVNNIWESQQQLGHHEAYHNGQPFISAPPRVDYSTLPPYEGGEQLPRPEWHHSEWIDPIQFQQQMIEMQQQQRGEGSSSGGGASADAFSFGQWFEELTDLFGQRQNRYYGGNR